VSRGSRQEGDLVSRGGRWGRLLAVGPSLREGGLEVGKARWLVDLVRKGGALGKGAHNRGNASVGHT